MFENLVESGSHKEDLSRKGSFLLVTTAIYGLLILTFVVATIWFTVAEMDTSDLELTTLVAPVPVPPPANEPPKEVKAVKPEANVDVRRALIAEVSAPGCPSTRRTASLPPGDRGSGRGCRDDRDGSAHQRSLRGRRLTTSMPRPLLVGRVAA